MTNKFLYESIAGSYGFDAESAKKAKKQSTSDPIGKFDPDVIYFKLHQSAKKNAVAAIDKIVKSLRKDLEFIQIGNSCMKDTDFKLKPKMTISLHLGLGGDSSSFTKRLSQVFKSSDVGVVALKSYVQDFCGEELAKQVTADNVYFGFDESKNKVVYFVTMELDS